MLGTNFRFAPPFSDHAVLQRDRQIPVWGVASPLQRVTVRLADRVAHVQATPKGNWLVRLPALPAGGPHTLTATTDDGESRLVDILIGEVWLASGQSNMEWQLHETSQGPEAVAALSPSIRLLTINTPAQLGRQASIDGRWQVATPDSLAEFSAVAGWFGLRLHRELGVPVGLVCNAKGGTRIQAWMSREALMLDPDGAADVAAFESFAFAVPKGGAPLTQDEWDAESLALDTGNSGLALGWAAPAFDDRDWPLMPLPARWQDHGHEENGVFWFRREAALPAAWRGRELELHLGAVDKHDDTYVEGVRVGGLSWADGGDTWCTRRVYRVLAQLTSRSHLQFAVRARSHCFHGGLIGPAGAMQLRLADTETAPGLPLAGDWHARREQDWGVRVAPDQRLGSGNPNSPYTQFDTRVAPLLPYGLRGVIWYQGENNVDEAPLYRRLLPQLVRDWRRAFAQGELPFIQVQLANFMAPDPLSGPSRWAELREAQAAGLAEPGVGLAVAIDVGEALDIHPRDKRSVGERLARWALVKTYGHAGDPCGPLYAGMTVESGARIRVSFHHASGLRTRDDRPPSHVALACADGVFHPAETQIEADTLVAWSDAVPAPVAVRYAWADNPEGCNLIGGTASLPASPFRSDTF